MKACTVFHGGAIFAEADEWIKSGQLPNGAYIRTHVKWRRSSDWYVTRHGNVSPINLCDIPKEIKMIMLLLDEPL